MNKTKLIQIQQKLKAPKGQYNSFGKYKYRSQEDILEAVKPHLASVGATLTVSDDLQYIGDRYYVKATAILYDESGEVIEQVSAYAREEEVKKGMDGSQITGTASSYARKYALNGLFLIDDTKDADTDEWKNQTDRQKENAKAEEVLEKKVEETSKKTIGDARAKALEKHLSQNGILVQTVYDLYKVKALKDLTEKQHENIANNLKKIKEHQDGSSSAA